MIHVLLETGVTGAVLKRRISSFTRLTNKIFRKNEKLSEKIKKFTGTEKKTNVTTISQK